MEQKGITKGVEEQITLNGISKLTMRGICIAIQEIGQKTKIDYMTTFSQISLSKQNRYLFELIFILWLFTLKKRLIYYFVLSVDCKIRIRETRIDDIVAQPTLSMSVASSAKQESMTTLDRFFFK